MRFRSLAPILLLLVAARPAAADTAQLAALKDNTLCEDAGGTLSNGAGDFFFAGRTDEPGTRRGLIAFDLSSIPAGSTVTSVTLRLEMSKTNSGAGAASVSLHRLLANWGEGTSNAGRGEGGCAAAAMGDATWIHARSPAVPWASPGGDFAATASATTSVDQPGPYAWGSTAAMVADVQSWVDDPTSNFGWLVRGDETTNPTAKRFNSRTNPLPTGQPILTVDYTPGGVGTPVYELTDKTTIVDPLPAPNIIGTASGGSYCLDPMRTGPVLYYLLGDTLAPPPEIMLVKADGAPCTTEIEMTW